MLTQFSVTNFKAFKDKLTFDLSKPRDYSFNTHLVRDGIVKNGIVYGENGSGKSSLAKAIFDIVSLANIPNRINYGDEIYQGAVDKPIEFEYHFKFDNDRLVYCYSKNNAGKIMEESLTCNGSQVFNKSLSTEKSGFIAISQKFPMNDQRKMELLHSANSVSVFNYLVAAFPLEKSHYMLKMAEFVKSMLWFRCLEERNYIGLDPSGVNIEEYIIKKELIGSFTQFLKDKSGQNFDFTPTSPDDKQLKCKIGGTDVLFRKIMSTGTASLELLYYWLCRMKEANAKFIFVDEFDAFYHYKLSLNVCDALFSEDFQAFLSSHNTMLLGNNNLRPDCGFLLQNGEIKALCELTDRGELRQGHNIEKMYRAGAFKH